MLLLWLQVSAPAFTSPYQDPRPLEDFLVFSAAPRPDVPDGQLHWVDNEVPGIDILGPDGLVRNMCPGEGLAWSLAGGDPYGGGAFVAVECQAPAEGWQMLAFHLCEVKIGTSIDNAQRLYTRVPPGAVLAGECGHTHLSLGYWAEETEKRPLPCPQWYVQGRYWVNPACLARLPALALAESERLGLAPDWELRFLTPGVLGPARQLAAAAVLVGLILYSLKAFTRPWDAPAKPPAESPPYEPMVKSAVGALFLVMLMALSLGPIWPIDGAGWSAYPAEAARYQAMASAAGYEDWRLLQAFYAAAVPRASDGRPAGSAPGKVFPPEAAAVIPFGETNAAEWGTVDPTQPGPHGAYLAWEAAAERWPASWFERTILGLPASRTALRQRAGLEVIASSPDMQRLGRRLGRTIRAQDLYGSSAGAVGRTQILPEYFAPGALCGDLPGMDVWNDPAAVAECTTRHLVVSGCWGRWWDTGDVWSALCGYNPGAWNDPAQQWYWDVLRDRMARLAAAEAATGPMLEAQAAAPTPDEKHVSTPVIGLLAAQALLDDGQGAGRLPPPLSDWVSQAAPAVRDQRANLRLVYRLFRAWVLIYHSPQALVEWNIEW